MIPRLYDTFDPACAVQFIRGPAASQEERLVAASMLLAWALWPVDGRAQVRRAARTTAYRVFLNHQSKFESCVKETGSISDAMSILANGAYEQFLKDVFIPLGGSRGVLGTASVRYFKRKIEARLGQATTAALVLDFMLRYQHQLGNFRRGASLNKAAWFIEAIGYGPNNGRHRSTVIDRWGEFQASLPLLFAYLHRSKIYPLMQLLGSLKTRRTAPGSSGSQRND